MAGLLPGWISKYWDEDPEHPPFKPGKGMIRRPDVIIVQNPNRPPTQDNIKQVVEMKFRLTHIIGNNLRIM